jgi:hypothetical protein
VRLNGDVLCLNRNLLVPFLREIILLGRTDGKPYNTTKLADYPLFAQILALCRAHKSTNPTIHRLHSAAHLCMVGLVDLLARHGTANI